MKTLPIIKILAILSVKLINRIGKTLLSFNFDLNLARRVPAYL
jgi:hypothetical protein